MGLEVRLARLIFAVGVTFCAACGGGDSNGSAPAPIRPGARLGWSQRVDSVPSIHALRFNLYVDGSAAPFLGTSCSDTAVGGMHECSGALPAMSAGRHTLELSSVLNGTESARSAPLVIEMSSVAASIVGVAAQTTSVCSSSSGGCYNVSVVADNLARPAGLARAGAGRLLFVEDQARVRVIEDGRLLPTVALSSDTNSRIVGLAADLDFPDTRFVFVATTEAQSNGVSSLIITRYRELNGLLGEGATIVSGLTAPVYPVVPMIVDADGLLYVAMPAYPSQGRVRLATLAFGGAVLRFDRDGSAPAGNPRSSPVIAYGYSQPTTIAVDSANNRLWIGGHSESGALLATLALDRLDRGWPAWPAPIDGPALDATFASPEKGPAMALAVRAASPTAIALGDVLVIGEIAADARPVPIDRLMLEETAVDVEGEVGGWFVSEVDGQGKGRILFLRRQP